MEKSNLVRFFFSAYFCCVGIVQGPSVEKEECYGSKKADSLECIYGEFESAAPGKTSILEEIGPACRCGCM